MTLKFCHICSIIPQGSLISFLNSLIIFTPTPPKSTLNSFRPSFKNYYLISHQIQLCCPYTFWSGPSPWSLVDLPGAKHLKNTDSVFPRSQRLSWAPQDRVGAHEPLSTLCWNADSLGLTQALCWYSQLLWVHGNSSPVLSHPEDT